METYRFAPPKYCRRRARHQVVAGGTPDCEYEPLEEGWGNRISIEDGIGFVAFP